MLVYALGTALCAAAPNIWALVAFRVVASLGIGGEWAAGAAMVAEVVPENRRVEAGALLYTSAPFGLFLATFANFQIAGVFFKGSPETSWRYRLPVRPHPRRRRLRRAPRSCASPSAGAGRAAGAARPRFASCSRPENAGAHAQRLLDGGDRAHRLVERQRLHPDRLDRPRAGDRQGERPSIAPATLALVEHWKALGDQRLQPGRPHRHAADDPGRQGHGAAQDVRALLPPVGRRRCWRRSASICRRSSASTCTSSSASRCSASSAASPTTCPSSSRPACAAAAPASATTSAASSPPPARSWSAPSRRAARTRSQTAIGALFWVGVVPLVGVVLALSPIVIETKGRAAGLSRPRGRYSSFLTM